MRGICDEKMRHLCDSQSCLPSVIRIETPSGLFSLSFLSVGEKKQQGGARAEREREGSYRWPFGLSVWCLGWLSNRETGREGQKERCGCFWVKLELWKEKKKKRWCVHFLPGLLGGSRHWIFTVASPFSTLSCHCKVCENSAHEELKVNRRVEKCVGSRCTAFRCFEGETTSSSVHIIQCFQNFFLLF